MVSRSKLFQAVVLVVCSVFSIPGLAQCTWYQDQDADGFGDPASATSAACIAALAGYTLNQLDCNDTHFNDATWKALGTAGVGSGNVVNTDLEIAPDGTPYILYRKFTDPNPTAVVAVKKFDGTNWVSVGQDPITFSDHMYGADMALDGNGVPYIAFVDQDLGEKVTVIKYTSSSNSWGVVGSRAMSAESVIGNGTASLALDANNIPHVLYASPSGDGFVMKYDPSGNAWYALGGGAFASMGSSEYSITIGSNNVPHVAFTESDVEISVMRFTTAWQVVGSRSFSDNFVSSPRVQLDGNSTPYAAYFDEGSLEVIVQRYDAPGARWVKLGNPVFSNDYAEVSLKVDRTNVPYVAHNGGGKLTVAKWDGSSWIDVANREFTDALNISLVIAPDNLPYVSCRDLVNSDFASVMTITPILVPPGTPVLAATKTSTCAGETTQLSINSGDLNDATQWKWYAAGCGSGVSLGTGLTLDVAPTVTTTYYARGEGSCVPPGNCGSITINVTPLPTAPTLSATANSVCPGSSSRLTITGGTLGDATTQRWAWYETTCGDVSRRLASSTTTLLVSPSANTTYYARGEGSCNGNCSAITIQIVPYPVVSLSAAPVVCAGESATLQVTSGSNAATYQWQTGSGSSWTDISGETNSSLTRAGSDLVLNNNDFKLVVKNSIGCGAEFQSSVTVYPQPAINTAGQPANATICRGANTTFQVTATGTSLTYQWQVDDGSGFTDVSNGGVYASATTSRLQITGATAAMNGYRYRAQVKTVIGGNTICNAAVSDAATLTINTGPSIDPGGQPANTSICPGSTAGFGVSASGLALTYQWQENTGAGFTDVADGGSYSGVTTATLSIASVPSAWTGRRYRVVIQSGTCSSVMSNGVATLSVGGGLSITGEPVDVEACPGGTASFMVSTTAGTLTYQWQEDAGSGFMDLVTSGTYSGVTSATLVINNVPASFHQYRYRVMVWNSGCSPVTSAAATLTMTAAPVVTQQPVDVASCLRGNAIFEVTATGTGLTYQWQVDNGNGNGFADIGSIGAYSGTTTARMQITGTLAVLNGHQYRVQISSMTGSTPCQVVSSDVVILTVNPVTIIDTGGQPASASTCPGGGVTFSVRASGVALTYQWQENTGSGFADVTNSGNYSGVTTATLSITGATIALTGRRYRVMIQGGCGSVMSDGAATLSVVAGFSISGQPAGVAVCPGGAASFAVSTTAGSLTYQWQEDAGSGFQDLPASGTYSGVTSSALVVNNVSTSLDRRRYRVVIQSSGCASVTSDGAAVLTVKAPPVIITSPSDIALCLGESNNMTVAASGPAVTYQWQADGSGSFKDIADGSVYRGAHAGTLAILRPPRSMNGYRLRAVLRWTCGEVTSAPATLVVNLPPVISAGPDKTIEQRGGVVLEGVVPMNVTNYAWVELANTPQENEIQPEVTPATDTYYTLAATDNNGCTATDQMLVKVVPLFNIPNAFSPNHDGVNDAWVINGLEQYPNARIKVFNRYGAPVFASESQSVYWDGSCQGKPVPWGTYYYTIDLQNGKKPLSGWVLIMN